MHKPDEARSIWPQAVLVAFAILFLLMFLVAVCLRIWSFAGTFLACVFVMMAFLSTPGLAQAPALTNLPPISARSKAFLVAASVASLVM